MNTSNPRSSSCWQTVACPKNVMIRPSGFFAILAALFVAAGLFAPTDSLQAAARNWSANANNANMNNASNWDTLPVTLDSWVFGSSLTTALNNDFGGFSVAGLTFNAGASAYVIGGNAITLTGDISNNSANLQTINLATTLVSNRTITTSAGGGNILFGGGIGGGFNITKSGLGTLTLTGTNSYANTAINLGSITYGSASLAGVTQTLGAISVAAGADSSVTSQGGSSGSSSLTFTTQTYNAGGALNYVVNGGTNGVDNQIKTTGAAGFINKQAFFNGADYAYRDTLNGYTRAAVYGTDAGFSNATTALVASAHNRVAASITGQGAVALNTIKFTGAGAVDLTQTAATVITLNTNSGILRSGGGSTTISGGDITNGSGLAYVVRADTALDSVTINSRILGVGTNTFTKSGDGVVTLGGNNTFTGTTYGNAGTLNINGTSLSSAFQANGTGILNVNGLNSVTGAATVTAQNGGFLNLNAAQNFTGVTTIQSGGTLGIGDDNALAGSSITFSTGNLQAVGGAHSTSAAINFANANNYAVTGSNALSLNGALNWNGTQILTVSNTALTTLGGTLTLRNDASNAGRTFTLAGTGNTVISGAIVNGSSLNGIVALSNSGTTTLAGNNSYSGATTITTGTVKLGHANGLGFGGIQTSATPGGTAVSSGATIDLSGQTVNEAISLNGSGVGGLGALINSNTTTTAVIGNGVAAIQPGAAVSGTGYSAGTTVTVTNPTTGTVAQGTVSLGVTAASFTINAGDKVYTAAPTVTITGGGGQTATGTAILSGGTTGTIVGINITSGGFGFTSAPTITFSAGTSSSGSINGSGTGNASNFAITGVALTDAGSGYTTAPTVTVNGNGTGATATATLSSVALTGATTVGGPGNITINSAVTGGVNTLTKIGAGTLTLGGASSYTGATTSSAGTLLVNGTFTSAITVNGGTFGGSGSSTQAITVNTGATITGGALGGIGNLTTTGLLTLNSGATVVIDFNSTTGSFDKIITNGLTLSNANLSLIDLGSGGGLSLGQTFVIVDKGAVGATAGTFTGLNQGDIVTVGDTSFSISYTGGDGNDIMLTVLSTSAVPEPSTYGVIAGAGVLAGAWFIRRRKNVAAGVV